MLQLKLDISKAYDRKDWLYLKDVMLKIRFAYQWVCWILMCVETVDYFVIVNKDVLGPIIPCRGLRQGNPLLGDLHGIRICNDAYVIFHLLFAYDCFLFVKAEEREAQIMKNILASCESSSGQVISLPKLFQDNFQNSHVE